MTPLVTIEVYGAVAFSSPQTDDECRAGVLRGSGPFLLQNVTGPVAELVSPGPGLWAPDASLLRAVRHGLHGLLRHGLRYGLYLHGLLHRALR